MELTQPAHRPSPLDEYPLHQAPLPINRVASTDRNFYDRCYLNAMDPDGKTLLVAGLGTYPNLGVRDGFVCLRDGDTQHAFRFSDVLDERSTEQSVGPLSVEVVDPLRSVRLRCETDNVAIDLTWQGTFSPVLEQRHLLLGHSRPILDAQRFAQLGTWQGRIEVAGNSHDVQDWVGSRDRSWGIRPSGEADPAGRTADEPMEGFWWLYLPLRFEDFAIVVIVQEEPDGFRTLNDATRVFADGRVEQLGWPRVEIDYHPGTRVPRGATLHLTTPTGEALVVEVESTTHIPLHLGCGYGGDSEWTHGQWRGRDWTSTSSYDHTDPEVSGRTPWGVVDHAARATCNGSPGQGLFEHGSLGRHDPSGFSDWLSVAKGADS